ncbi:SDR family oxidoreductase [Dactylosporangium sp. AC04546]|uniref:SDR family oxidoreductase n=1 Tax=Dactylosporangium sp. AC04546 TaxID=2862460 RepID=UPI001EE03DBD|nr:SDR family oxidoreductase [Dactylosporangium sp. AC04546]WVK81337.1 SDR family oxidoreductase [Dactylosporangium sp. AC04546]
MSRTVLVTGGNRGIGLTVARAMADAGDKVAVTYRTGEPPEGLFGVRCDVTDPATVEAAFAEIEAQYGPVEVLVANAGIIRDALVPMLAVDDFATVLDTNVVAAFRVAKRASEGMLKARWGRIVFVSSVMGFMGSPGQANYAASKSAMLGLARSLAWELGPRNITANVVVPGLIETDMISDLSDRRRDDLVRQTALRRTGTAREVAAVVRFLAGDEAAFVTGAAVPVSGGLAMGL